MSISIVSSIHCKFGWLPDVPDQRDIPFISIFRVPAKLSSRVDLRGGCSAIEQQGNLGSCTAQALIGCLEFLELRSGKIASRQPTKNRSSQNRPQAAILHVGCAPFDRLMALNGVEGLARDIGECRQVENSFRDLSRLFVYYNEREDMGTVLEDSGAMLRTGIKTLKKLGVCKEASWPYLISRFTKRPSSACYREASGHQVTAYQRLATLQEMKACLAMGLPFVFGFAVYEHVMSEQVRKTGNIRLPRRNERMVGGHAVMAVGYDDRKEIIVFRNSWGWEWGKKGYGALPYAYLETRELSDDFWCIQATESNLYTRWRLNLNEIANA